MSERPELSGIDRRDILQGVAAAAVISSGIAAQASAQQTARASEAPLPPELKFGITTQPLFPVAETTSGKVRGILNGTIREFRGVPYGAPTDGRNRFMPPQKPSPWAGVRDCLAYGQSSPQVPTDMTWEYGQLIYWDRIIGLGGMGEDCLNLNIWTPGVNDGGKRAVMVSFHGGGWASGTGNAPIYDGAMLSRYGDVVVVTVNHRLASFGYAQLADLGAPQTFAEAGVSGVMDMVAALEWIRDNIQRFGGDPGTVMIFGQSGGGQKVSTLLATPSAEGLFHRAAVQSGTLLRHQTREQATIEAEKLLKALGVSGRNAADIQKFSWREILQAQAACGGNFAPVVDGAVLPRHPFDPAAPRESAGVPMIISTTLHDAGLLLDNFDLSEEGLAHIFRERWGDRGAAILAAYRQERPDDSPYLIQALAFTDATRGDTMLQAERKAALNVAPSYVYVWDWISDAFDGKFGATHALDVEPSFHIHRGPASGSGGAAGRLMVDRLAATWVAFAKTGNPANALIPNWPAYESGRRATMVFDTNMRVIDDYRGDFVRLIGETA